VPHIWIDEPRGVSLQDVIDRNMLTLFAGAEDSARVVQAVCDEVGLPVRIVWWTAWPAAAAKRWLERIGAEENGALIVRPDGHVFWRSLSHPDAESLSRIRALADCWGVAKQ
jgi:hypothetical protein